MSYIALYRKFRPGTFDEVKGQDHIVTTLKNQLKSDRVGHAYLFCGTRGTGKTTMAKLLAKAVNCEHPTENGPCGQCESCKAISDGSSLNVIEIDAASNSGVDNIRQINEAVQYSPAQGKYLVYIIDEVHMLSAGAYNALLKTLEEPPEYVIFILATTDEHKIPVTIKSRCQRYDFHRISLDTIADRLEEIVNREGGEATKDALRFIARLGDGSMRDALSILDECISSNLGKTLDREGVLKTVGAVSVDIYKDLLVAIKENTPVKVLDIVNEAIWNGKDLIKFVDDFTWFMRNMLFLKLSPDIAGELDMTEETIEDLKKMGNDFSVETLTRYLNILQETCSGIRSSSVKRITMEMAFLKMMHPETDVDYSAIINRLDNLEKGERPASVTAETGETKPEIDSRALEVEIIRVVEEKFNEFRKEMSSVPRSAPAEPLDKKRQSEIIKKNIKDNYPDAEAEDIFKLADEWDTLILPKLNGLQKSYASDVGIEPSPDYKADGPARLRIVFDENEIDNNPRYGYFTDEKRKESFEDTLSEIIGKKVEIDVILRKGVKGVLDKESRALNKINFDDIKIKESEEDYNG